ncbi:TSUP family transporter [Candidatus Pseudothioglobus singularis]|nr:TSUP family transporter [Candidatus Pseudothioglobus singularis]MDB4822461.1 TSUP family transporter [Candidatus Pseudothioglobus singularis]
MFAYPAEVYLIIALIAVVQSIIGVGVLIFGTPLLLILGYEYMEVITILAPISLSLSLITWFKYRIAVELDRNYLLFPITIFCGLFFSTYLSQFILNILIGLVLIILGVYGIIVNSKNKQPKRNYAISQIYKTFLTQTVALIHGFSNQGGSLLVVIASIIHDEKFARRANIAFVYGYMAIVQILSILIIDSSLFINLFNPLLIVIAIIIFYLVDILFVRLRHKYYNNIISYSIVFFGILLTTNQLL